MIEEAFKQRLLEVLTNHIGRERGIIARDLVQEMCGETHPRMERHLRYAIQQLREEGHHICAYPGSGYFMAADATELNETCKYLVDRSMTSLKQVAAMKRVSVPDLHGQMRLPT